MKRRVHRCREAPSSRPPESRDGAGREAIRARGAAKPSVDGARGALARQASHRHPTRIDLAAQIPRAPTAPRIVSAYRSREPERQRSKTNGAIRGRVGRATQPTLDREQQLQEQLRLVAHLSHRCWDGDSQTDELPLQGRSWKA